MTEKDHVDSTGNTDSQTTVPEEKEIEVKPGSC
jgi:hypothetical protein